MTPEALNIQVTNGHPYNKNKVDGMHFDVNLALQVQQNLISIFWNSSVEWFDAYFNLTIRFLLWLNQNIALSQS